MSTVKISPGNQKMGSIPSVSLPSGITCRQCECQKKCYAKRLERIRKSVAMAYKHNLKVLNNSPDVYWREVEASIMMSRYFRFHVSGDIPDDVYLLHMVEIAKRNTHCEILCFTKKYELINEYLSSGERFPRNLHMILSAWVGLDMVNPFNLPEAHVLYRDGTTTARSDAKPCGGNCSDCAITYGGCWALHDGEQILFNEH